MKLLLALSLSLFAMIGYAAEDDDDDEDTETATSCPFASGTFSENMQNRVLRTTEAGYTHYAGTSRADPSHTEIKITLKNALLSSWTCATWNVELLLPTGVQLKTGTTVVRSALTYSSEVSFEIKFDDSFQSVPSRSNAYSALGVGEHQTMTALLVVEVFNGEDIPETSTPHSDTQGRWYFPVSLRIAEIMRPG